MKNVRHVAQTHVAKDGVWRDVVAWINAVNVETKKICSCVAVSAVFSGLVGQRFEDVAFEQTVVGSSMFVDRRHEVSECCVRFVVACHFPHVGVRGLFNRAI